MSIYYVYLYRDEKGSPIYVGKGNNRRAWDHLRRKDKHPLTHKIQKMIREGYNPQPEFLITGVDEEFALFAEEEAIKKYGRRDLGAGTLLNLSDGGRQGASGSIRSNEFKMNVSKLHKGKMVSDETKAKLSASKKGKPTWNKGKTHTEETRAKIASASKGRIGTFKGKTHTEETRAKLSAAQKGKPKPKYACMLHNRKEYSRNTFIQHFPELQ
jgi:hypothetical protein